MFDILRHVSIVRQKVTLPVPTPVTVTIHPGGGWGGRWRPLGRRRVGLGRGRQPVAGFTLVTTGSVTAQDTGHSSEPMY